MILSFDLFVVTLWEFFNELLFRLSRSPAQILIRWSVQHGFITIPKTSQKSRLLTNADVFNWTIPDEDMKVLVSNKYEVTNENGHWLITHYCFSRMHLVINRGRVRGIQRVILWEKRVWNNSKWITSLFLLDSTFFLFFSLHDSIRLTKKFLFHE